MNQETIRKDQNHRVWSERDDGFINMMTNIQETLHSSIGNTGRQLTALRSLCITIMTCNVV